MKAIFGVAATVCCLVACIHGVTQSDSVEKTTASKWRETRCKLLRILCLKSHDSESRTENPFVRNSVGRKAIRRKNAAKKDSETQ